jgi:RNA-directed DNA polymerase
MNSLQFKRSELKTFCFLVKSRPIELESICLNIDDYYGEWEELKKDKKTGEFKRFSDGTFKKRILRPSKTNLKRIQSNIKSVLLSKVNLPSNVFGGVKTKSNITNAKRHQGNRFQFCTDLENFYPSIKSKMVYDSLIKLKFSSEVARLITRLCTWKNNLPQGAPTSTHLSNLVFQDTDHKLIEFCKVNGLTYTRYIDDLTFSSQVCFKHLTSQIIEIILEGSFKVNQRKTIYSGNQTITGIVVLPNRIDAPESIKHRSLLEQEGVGGLMPITSYVNRICQTNKKKK